MRTFIIPFISILFLLPSANTQARIIHVPADSSCIQCAINGALDGDTVLVAPGHYYERINFYGKAILVASNFIFDNDTTTIDSTIIDGEGSGSVVRFFSGEDSNSIIGGFTITNGHASAGGGIFCQLFSSPTIKNNVIAGNSALVAGGGIACDFASPIINNNVISDNSASQGGGIFCINSWWTIISNNTIIGNSSTTDGGGIYCLNYSSPVISYNMIAYNTAHSEHGGGITCSDYSSPVISNNTIVGNSTPGIGGAIMGYAHTSAVISHNVISHSRDGGGIAFIYSNPAIYYNNFWNEVNGNFYGCPAGVGDTTWGTNFNGTPCDSFFNIIRDPLFADTINFELLCNSPCIDAGDPSIYVPSDSGGCRIDMGAYEYPYTLGDANGDSTIDIADVVFVINYLFANGPSPCPYHAADTNCDGLVDIADVVCLINYLFVGGPLPCGF